MRRKKKSANKPSGTNDFFEAYDFFGTDEAFQSEEAKKWYEINSIIEDRTNRRTTSLLLCGPIPAAEYDKIYFLVKEAEDFKLMDRLREENMSFSRYLGNKYPRLSDKSRSILSNHARYVDR